MSEKHIKQIKQQLPEGERIHHMYRACEGDTRVITKDRNGNEIRYTVKWHAADDSVTIERF